MVTEPGPLSSSVDPSALPPPPPARTRTRTPLTRSSTRSQSRSRSERQLCSDRPCKRLFTPAIKRLLKDWLVRRRDHPYPSRVEKEALSARTGLTYTQVCNWFANWRRKLRDCAGSAPLPWAELIRRYSLGSQLRSRSYRSHAQERFSISSSDSIWKGTGAGTDCNLERRRDMDITRLHLEDSRSDSGSMHSQQGESERWTSRAGADGRQGRQKEELDAAEALAHLSLPSLHWVSHVSNS